MILWNQNSSSLGAVLLNNLWLCIIFGVLSIALLAFYQYLKIARKNKNLINSNNDLSEKEKNEIHNNNFANLMALLSAISALTAIIMPIIPNISISGLGGGDSTTPIETTVGPTIVTSVKSIATDISTHNNTGTTNPLTKNTTNVKTTVSSKDLSTESLGTYDGKGIINNKKELIGTFSPTVNKYKYILNTSYSGIYGFQCFIDSVKKSYTIEITDENDEVLETYNVDSNKVTYNPSLCSNKTYNVTVSANWGYPSYKIIVNFPDSNSFN